MKKIVTSLALLLILTLPSIVPAAQPAAPVRRATTTVSKPAWWQTALVGGLLASVGMPTTLTATPMKRQSAPQIDAIPMEYIAGMKRKKFSVMPHRFLHQ